MKNLNLKMTACAFAAAALLTACGGGGTTPGANNSNSDTSSESADNNNTSGESGDTGTCTTATTCINFSEATAALVGFEGMEESPPIVSDPVMESNKVAKLTKTTAMKDWAGASVVIGGNKTITRIDPTKSVTLRVYAAEAGQDVMLKIENAEIPSVFKEATVKTTKANAWETLTFSYPDADANATYNKFSVFPAFLKSTNTILYFDELKYTAKETTTPTAPTTGGLTLITFDETPIASTLAAFEGAAFEQDSDGTNKIAKFIKPTTAQPWGGATFTSCPTGTLGAMPPIPFTSNLQTISVRVKAPRAGVMFSLEVKDKYNPGNLVFAQTSNIGTDWETLTFNFANKTFGNSLDTSTTYNQLSIFPNFDKANEGSASSESTNSIYYFDDVKLVGSTATLGTCPAAPVTSSPTDAPATPTQSAANVISIYSDAYSPTAGVNLNPNWGQNTVQTIETIANNQVMKLTSFNYQGIDFDNNRIDVSAKTSLHVDMWSANATKVDVFLIDPTSEQPYSVTLNANAWTSVDIPLSSYNNLTGKNAIRQLKMVAEPSNTTVFVDNIYFK